MLFDVWYHSLYINADIPIRNPPSKHQAKITEILRAIEIAKETQSMVPLFSIQLTDCIGDTEIVSYCRYLQYMITVLKDEGSME